MGYPERAAIYKRIEKARGRHLISYITSVRPNASGNMASDSVPEFIRQLNIIDRKHKDLDVLIISNGGDPIVSARIVSLIRSRFEHFTVLVPYVAYSAATLVALGADQIVMHPFANLGPVDPQITRSKESKEGSEQFSFSTEDLRNYFDFVRTDVGLSDQVQMVKAFELLCQEVGPIPIGFAKRSAQLMLTLGEKLLAMHLGDSSKAKAITETLNRSYHHHGYPLGRSEAHEIGLPVAESNVDLEAMLWEVWEDIEQDMQCNQPFDPLRVVLGERSVELLAPVQQLQLPLDLPKEVAQAIYQQFLQQFRITLVAPVDFEITNATIESKEARSTFKSRGKISAARLPDMNIALNIVHTWQGWDFVRN